MMQDYKASRGPRGVHSARGSVVKVEVRFDIRDEFELPLGDMWGIVELANAPAKGDRIDIGSGCAELHGLGLPPDMVVVGVERCGQSEAFEWLALLEDLWVENVASSRPLIRALEERLGLNLMPYRDGLE